MPVRGKSTSQPLRNSANRRKRQIRMQADSRKSITRDFMNIKIDTHSTHEGRSRSFLHYQEQYLRVLFFLYSCTILRQTRNASRMCERCGTNRLVRFTRSGFSLVGGKQQPPSPRRLPRGSALERGAGERERGTQRQRECGSSGCHQPCRRAGGEQL